MWDPSGSASRYDLGVKGLQERVEYNRPFSIEAWQKSMDALKDRKCGKVSRPFGQRVAHV